MIKSRTKTGQKQHDSEVLKWVRQKTREGYRIQADLPGCEKPSVINGEIPDALARKGDKEKMLEVETSETLMRDIKQRRNFRKWADRKKKRSFFVKVVKKR